MASVPSAEPAGAAPVPTPRSQRGFIKSYGEGRVCVHAGCRTKLSRYNASELCHRHAGERDARLYRERL